MRQTGIILALVAILGSAVLLVTQAAMTRHDAAELKAERELVEQFYRLRGQYPVTRPADVGGDMVWYNRLVREGHAIPLPTTRP